MSAKNQTIGNCKDCKFWNHYDSGYRKFNHCDIFGTVYEPNDSATKFELIEYADDDQGLESFLVTGPLFGCIHFQPPKHKE